MLGPLWQATRDLHHQAEDHPLARAMIAGTITPQAWADWLQAHMTIQLVLDPHLPLAVRRTDALALDLLALLPVEAHPSRMAADFAGTLTDTVTIFGAAYLTIGALPMGGAATVAVRREGAQLVIEGVADGARARLKAEAATGLAGQRLTEGLAGQWIQPYWLWLTADQAGGTLTVEAVEGRVSITARMPT